MRHSTERPGPHDRDEPAFTADDTGTLRQAASIARPEPGRHAGRSVVAWTAVVILSVGLGFVALLGIEPLKQQLHATQALLVDANRNVATLQRQVSTLEVYRAALQEERDGLAEQAARSQKGAAAMQHLAEAMGAAFAPDIDRGNISLRYVEGNMALDIVNDVLFSGSLGHLSEGGKLILRRAAGFLQQMADSRLEVSGHTDTQPLSAALVHIYATNWELSCVRAAEVASYLEQAGHMPPHRLVAQGFAGTKPLMSNESAAGRRRNQRIELVLRQQSVDDPSLQDPNTP